MNEGTEITVTGPPDINNFDKAHWARSYNGFIGMEGTIVSEPTVVGICQVKLANGDTRTMHTSTLSIREDGKWV